MEFTPLKLNFFLFFKLPSAFWSGVRVKSISKEQCIVTVKHRWFNQNPFKSLYFAVQAMAAELTTGALVMMSSALQPALAQSLTRKCARGCQHRMLRIILA